MFIRYIWFVQVSVGGVVLVSRSTSSLRTNWNAVSTEKALKLGNPFFAPMIHGTP